VLEAIRHCPTVRSFVNITTDKVYLNNDSGVAFRESDPLCGYDPYSNSKSCSELVTYSYKHSFFNPKDYKEHRVSISTARAGNVIGGGDWANFRLVPDLVKSILRGEEMVVRNPSQTRPWQHVLEPLYLYLKIAKAQYDDVKFSGCYNIGPNIENCLSVRALMDCFCKYSPQAKYKIQTQTGAKHEAARLELDNTLVARTFGYTPTLNVDQTIKSIIDWTNAFANGEDMKKITMTQIDDFFAKVNK
jgi:CDP-glucose 4,6-dehydratase